MPRFPLGRCSGSGRKTCWGKRGRGLQLAAESFAGSAGPRRYLRCGADARCFSVLRFSLRQERIGAEASQQIIQHQAVGYALADAKTDHRGCAGAELACMPRVSIRPAPGALELAIPRQGIRIGSSGGVITDLMRGCRASKVMATNLPARPVLLPGRCGVAALSPAGNIGVRPQPVCTRLIARSRV